MTSKNLFATLLAVLACLNASADDLRMTFAPAKGTFSIASTTAAATVVLATDDAEVVGTAAQCLASDVAAVTGSAPNIVSLDGLQQLPARLNSGSEPIIAGTLGQSSLIDALAEAALIDADAVRGRWEVFGIQLVEAPLPGVPRAMVVYGSTPRGTAYGLLHLSRLMGVSPYIWWADVAPQHRDFVGMLGRKLLSREPSVRYRGIFINDEDWGLTPWAAKNLDKAYNNIGPGTYARVMELLLRLRANTLWPAMHPCSQAFWANKDNLPVARRYDIVLGSSHCEQMLRDNEWEWRREPWNGVNEDWNYPQNSAKIQRYWEERVVESAGFEAMYTVGMRGVHDWGISGYPTTEDKVRGLTDIIAFQRSLLRKHIGEPSQVPQLFIPYKEVLDAYNAGLQVPEDITLCWVDDNHGYIRQLPTPEEQARSGGNGIYYHLSYWGRPHDYLWLCSHSPSLISYELSRAYDQGVRTLWIVNVGDIKPAEAELECCMDLAWDIESWTPGRAWGYSRHWAAETFGEELADDIAAIKREYYRLASGGKPEHVFAVAYTRVEQEHRMADYAALTAKVEALKGRIPAALADAFFQLIEYPVKGAAAMNVKTFRAPQSLTLAACGRCDEALQAAAEARDAYQQITSLTATYNKEIAGGKWNGIMSAQPRRLKQFQLPPLAAADSVAAQIRPLPAEPIDTLVPATAFSAASPTVVRLEGLGISDHSVGVWPLDMTAHTATDAPSLEYLLPVAAGENLISVRCLPTFPINTGYDLRLALSIDDAGPQTVSLKHSADKGTWNRAVLQGYNDATLTHTATAPGTVRLRVALLDPGLVVSDIRVRHSPRP